MRLFKIFVIAFVAVLSTTYVAEAQQRSARYTLGDISNNEIADSIDFDLNAPVLTEGDGKLYHIRKINLHGVKYLNHDILRSASGLVPGDSVYLPGPFIQNAANRLWMQRYFEDIQIGATIEGDSLDLEVVLKERPRVMNWKVAGVPKSKSTDLIDELKLKRGHELSDYVLDKNTKLIKKHFVDKGFRNCEVTASFENDSIIKQGVNVTFNVVKNDRVRIGNITFEGNNDIESKRLERTFKKTHKVSYKFWQQTKLMEKDFEDDKELLIDFYNSKGYRNAHILSDSLYTIDAKRIGLHIKLDEGKKYYIRKVSWVGNSRYDTEYLDQLLAVKSGDVYDKKSIHKRLGIGKEMNPDEMSISSLYQNDGYLVSQIEPAEIIIGPDSLDLEIRVFEGKQFTINNIGISGNMRVDDEVIRRELYTRPGELYNRALLMQTIRTLAAMQHFNEEAIAPDIKLVQGSSDLVDINWPLEEKASDQFNIAAGWGSGTFVGSVGITLNNLSVRNFFDKGAWRPYPMGQNQRLSVSGQTNGTYYKAISVSFSEPWLGGRKPNSLTISGHASESNDAYYVWQTATTYFRSYGASIGLGKRLSWPDPYFQFYSELSYLRYGLQGYTSFIMENGNANTLAAKIVLGRNSTDQPIYPRRGSDISFSLQITPPFSSWDGKDYSDPNLSEQDRWRWIEFHKWQFKAQWFQALSPDSKLVLMAKAEMGYLGHYNKYKLSPFERFQVGGDGMSGYTMYGVDIISLRGYQDGALDSSYYSVAYNKYSLELRYPIILKPSSQIYVLGFLEAGNGFESWADFAPWRVKRSAGVGVRLYLPIVGMLGIDWGWGFDPPTGSKTRSGSQFHFVIGQNF